MLPHEKIRGETNLISYYCPFNPWLVCPACLLRMQPRLWNDLKTTLAGEVGCESNLTAIRLSSALGKDQTFNPRQRSIYKVVFEFRRVFIR
jgi:hypothetical protein